MSKVRIQKLLSQAGVCSRRAAEELMLQGRVSVNGRPCTELGTRVDPEKDRVFLDGRLVELKGLGKNHVYLVLNKPAGVLTTLKDPYGRPTIKRLLARFTKRRVYPVGRLDRDSQGLLLCTDDGELANRLIHPRYKVEKVYEVTVRGHPKRQDIRRLEQGGLEIEGRAMQPCTIRLLARRRGGSVWQVRLKEGRKRQIRRMFKAIGHEVTRLVRTAIGPIELGDLPPGKARMLKGAEVQALRRAAGMDLPKGRGRKEDDSGGQKTPQTEI